MAAQEGHAPWDDFLSDFTLILDSGERLKCHKRELSKASPVLKTMLMTEMKETKTSEMHMTGVDLETATNLMQYVYAGESSVQTSKAMETLSGQSAMEMRYDRQVFIKDFGKKLNLSPELMRLAHMYQVQGLVDLCEDRLKATKPAGNPWTADDIRKLAKDIDNKTLKDCSDMWHASDAFQTLICGSCKGTTEKPVVKLSCRGTCKRETIVSGAQPMVEYPAHGIPRVSKVMIKPSTPN